MDQWSDLRSTYDESRPLLFAGGFIYPGKLYAFLPDAGRSTYLATTKRLLPVIDPETRIFAAHMQGEPPPLKAPVLQVADLRALQSALTSMNQGDSSSSGIYPRIFPVRAAVKFATGWAWNNRRELSLVSPLACLVVESAAGGKDFAPYP